MANIVNAEEERLLNDSVGLSPANDRFIGIFPASKSESELESGDATGEITGYTGDRKAVSLGAVAQVDGKATTSSDADVEFEDMPEQTGADEVGYHGLFDADSGGNVLWWAPVDPTRETQAGDTLRFPAGDITYDLD